jgi:MtrB/PioB family decaheme-associated outer membrane protein
MNMNNQHPGFSKNLLVLALLAALSPAQAEEESIAQLIKPESSISIGLGATSGDKEDKALFGVYNGMRRDNYHGLLDIDAVQRDDATGTWTTLEGRHLGLDDRELHFSQERQGDWKYFVDYNQLVRYNQRTINTGMTGAGTTAPVITLLGAPGTGTNIDLNIKRESVGLGVEKWLTPSLQFEANAKNEDKKGARVFGKGFACSATWVTNGSCVAATQWAMLMLPEPIDSTTRQFEAKLNFSSDKLMLSGGYYGSFYTNAYGNLRPIVPATLNYPMGTAVTLDTGLQNVLGMPMALPPDNQAHQFYVDGNYAFTPTTRMTFKYAFTRATQNDNFLDSGLTGAPAGRTDLGGKLDTHLAQLGLTTRPMPKLSVNANLRYEERNDKTPQALYSVEGTEQFANSKYSLKKLAGKLEGSYQLPDNYRATLGVDYEMYDRGNFTSPGCAAYDAAGDCLNDSIAGVSGLRAETRETGYRAELRRAMSETLTGAVSYLTSQRTGSTWLKPLSLPATGVVAQSDSVIYGSTGRNEFPMIFMDRTRDKVKVSADWATTERLTLQFVVENAKDWYSGPTTKGLRDSGSFFYSVDAALALSDAWKLTGYWSQGDQELHVDHSNGYMMVIRNLTTTLGMGATGKLSSKFEVGGDLAYLNDSTQYNQGLDANATAANKTFYNSSGFYGLPEVTYSEIRLKFFGKYAVQKNADIRVDLVHQRAKLEEWTWGANDSNPFLYSDNTTITIKPEQRVTFIGARYIYKWQ